MKSGNLNFLERSELLQACNGTDLPLPLLYSLRKGTRGQVRSRRVIPLRQSRITPRAGHRNQAVLQSVYWIAQDWAGSDIQDDSLLWEVTASGMRKTKCSCKYLTNSRYSETTVWICIPKAVRFCFVGLDKGRGSEKKGGHTEWNKKNGTFENPNKNWRNPRKKIYSQKLNHYN